MEDWEKELRERLEKELPEGVYRIGSPGDELILHTGKDGKIDFEVALIRYIRTPNQLGLLLKAMEADPESYKEYRGELTQEKLENFLRELYTNGTR